MSKAFLLSLLLFPNYSFASAKFVTEGRCTYFVDHGKKVGSICSANKGLGAPISLDNLPQKISSVVNVKSAVKESRKHYDGYSTDLLVKAIISVENHNADPEAISSSGAVGLMQILPSTAGISEEKLRNPKINIKHGLNYLDKMYERYSDRDKPLKFALAAYLVGPTNLDNAIREYGVRKWSDLEQAIQSGWNVKDSNGTNAVEYASRVIRNYFDIMSRESRD